MNKAFSLLQLMVVIGIIGLLTAIAKPYYSSYLNKSKVALAALALNDYNLKAMALYNEGLITPDVTSIVLDGVTYQDNTPRAVDYPPVIGATFLGPGSVYINGNGWMFCVYVGGLNFTGYQEGIGGGLSRLCSRVVVNNGIFTTYCGRWDDNGLEIPLEYLPNECNEPYVSAH